MADSDNPGWYDPEDTLPPLPDEPEDYGPSIRSGGGDFRFSRTTGGGWSDPSGVAIRLLSEEGYAVHFKVDLPLAARLAYELRSHLAADKRNTLSPVFAPPQLPSCPPAAHDIPLGFDASDEPRLAVKKDVHDDWFFVGLRSRRASLSIQMQQGVAFHVHRWLSDAL